MLVASLWHLDCMGLYVMCVHILLLVWLLFYTSVLACFRLHRLLEISTTGILTQISWLGYGLLTILHKFLKLGKYRPVVSSSNLVQNEFGVWEIFLPNNTDGSPAIPHGSRVKVFNKFLYSFVSAPTSDCMFYLEEMVSLLQAIFFRSCTETYICLLRMFITYFQHQT